GVQNSEDRSHIGAWSNLIAHDPQRLVSISSEEYESVEFVRNGVEGAASLRSHESVKQILCSNHVLIDISAISHSTWAALLKCAYDLGISVRVLYVEPA